MNASAEESTYILGNGHQLDTSILTYLQEMIGYCLKRHHREMAGYYENAWDYAAEKIYGPLPPSKGFSTGQDPASIKTKFPEGAGRPPEPWPLKKIVKRFTAEWNGCNFTFETLECLHIISGPSGWEAPVKRRRCIHCAAAAEKSLAKKRPAASVGVSTAKSKAVSA